MKNVAVYCSSQSGLPDEICCGAGFIAATIGNAAAGMVYGGVNAGLMHTLAVAASESAAVVTGVVPKVFMERTDLRCDVVIPAEDLADRKARMIMLADIFVVLPGGIGTIDEWISTLSDFTVQEKSGTSVDKPVLVWNYKGMYNGIIGQLKSSSKSVFAKGRRIDRSEIFDTAEALAGRLKELLG